MTTSERIQVLLHAGIEERTIAAILGADFADVVHFTRDPSFDVPVFDPGDINLAPYARLDGARFTGEVVANRHVQSTAGDGSGQDGTTLFPEGKVWVGWPSGGDPTAPMLETFSMDDAEDRFQIIRDGSLRWGDGVAAPDLAMWRAGGFLNLGPESEVGQPHPAAVQIASDASLLVAAHGAVAHPSWAYLDPAGYFEAAVSGDPAAAHVFSTGPATESNWRYDIRADGTMRWGGGIDPADVILQRTSPGVLVMGDRTYTEPVVQFATAGGTANIYLQNDGTDAYIDMNPGDPLTIVVGKKGGGIQLRSPDGLTRKTLTIDNAGALALV